MQPEWAVGGPSVCPSCGVEMAFGLLACPSCRRLVHGDRLANFREMAERAEMEGRLADAMAAWRDALELLPPSSRQFAAVAEKVADLGRRVDSAPASPRADKSPDVTAMGTAAGAAGGLALLLFKSKFLFWLLLTKGKLLLLGLTKAGTFLTMFAALGVYWSLYGFWFALGLILSIYVHEMGHVVALARYGMKVDAPLFIPGLGAVIRLRQDFHDPRQDNRVGLAGPIWGLGAALFCLAAYLATGLPVLMALSRIGAFINLFNLIPLGSLDGGRAFRSFTRPERWLAVTALATAWACTNDGLILLLMIVGVVRTVADRPAETPDRPGLLTYIVLVAALSVLADPATLPKG